MLQNRSFRFPEELQLGKSSAVTSQEFEFKVTIEPKNGVHGC